MKIFNNIFDFNKKKKTSVLIGIFDGIHRGHKKVLKDFINISKVTNTESVLITFNPHPRELILDNENFKLINTIDERLELLEKENLDNIIIHPFDLNFSKLSYKEFVLNYLNEKLNMSNLIIGYDNRFGKNREGDFEKLKELSSENDFNIRKLEVLKEGEINISSTKIRNAILEGDMNLANNYLGYKFSISGEVVKGNKIGSDIGFPTINIETNKNKIIPKNGVYSVDISIKNNIYKGIMNIGFRPTIEKENNKQTLEVNIFDFDKNVYGEKVKIFIKGRVRDEIKFDNLECLKEQIKKDISSIKNN